ncbi:transmembrane protein 6/97 [Aspergillus varians]
MSSLWSRKRDLIYFGFFAIHIPIIFLVDAVPVLPSLLDNAISRQLRDFYIATYRDKFFEGPVPVWFTSYTWMEILYHAPLSIWALGALLRILDSNPAGSASGFRVWILDSGLPGASDFLGGSRLTRHLTLADDPLVPVHLLVFGFQSFLTSWTCLCEVWAWEDRTVAEKQNLTTLYGPYVALGAFMTLDMFWRIRVKLLNKSKRE